MNDDEAYQAIFDLVNRHKDKNFVQRWIKPHEYPVLDMGNGNYGSHLISSTKVNGQTLLYPEIIQRPGSHELEQLGRKEALDYALQSGEYIPMKSDEEADWFGKNYKRLWGLRGVAPHMEDQYPE